MLNTLDVDCSSAGLNIVLEKLYNELGTFGMGPFTGSVVRVRMNRVFFRMKPFSSDSCEWILSQERFYRIQPTTKLIPSLKKKFLLEAGTYHRSQEKTSSEAGIMNPS